MRPISSAWALATLALVVHIAISAQEQPLPDLGDRESSLLSPHEEQALGESFMMELRRTVRTVDDPIIKYFVKTNMYELAEHSDLTIVELQPVIIEAKALNAFAAPGGIIGINLGLFRFAEDVHEYSSVVAHELAHLSQKHFARRIEHSRQLTVAQLLGFLTSAAVLASGATDAGLAGIAGTYSMVERDALRYSRSQEQEADRIGFNALTAAGFDPFGAPRMFERMQYLYRGQDELTEYLSSHPIAETRVADLRLQAQDLEEKEYPPNWDYQLIRTRAIQPFVESRTAITRNPEDIEGDEIPDRYERALVLSENDRHVEAVATMKEIVEEMPNSILALSCYADLLIKAGQSLHAIELLEESLADTPDNAPLSMLYAEALNAVERHEDATRVLRRQARIHSTDSDIWFELAETAGLAQDIVEVHRARAEFYALRGQYAEAIQNLQNAKRRNDGKSFRLEATIDQRILELRDRADSDA